MRANADLPGSALLSLCRRGGGFSSQYLVTLVGGILLTLPILLFVHRYIDDLGRSMDGEIRWVEVGRPLADWLFSLLNIGDHGVAVAPLHQLLTVAIVSLIGVVAARVYGIRSPFWTALATLPLLGQPYAMENLSYGFDCLGMFLAMGLAVLAAVALAVEPGRRGLISSVVLLFASLCFYQPGTSAFIPFALMLVIGEKLNLLDPSLESRRTTIRWITLIVLSYLAALILYSLLLQIAFHARTSYAAEQGQLLAMDLQLPAAMLRNSAAYWFAIYDDWNKWTVAAPFLALAFAYGLVVWQSPPRSDTKGRVPVRSGLTRLFGILASVLVIGVVSPGALLALKDPLEGVPRMLLFIGPLLASLQLQVVSGASRFRRSGSTPGLHVVLMAAVVGAVWLQIVFAYAYGHAFAAQAEFEAGRLSRLVDGITRLQQRQGDSRATELSFVGGMPKSPVLQNTRRKFPLIDRLVPRLIKNDWAWGWKQLELQGVELGRSKHLQQDLAGTFCGDLQTAECTTEYTIQLRDRTLMVHMRR